MMHGDQMKCNVITKMNARRKKKYYVRVLTKPNQTKAWNGKAKAKAWQAKACIGFWFIFLDFLYYFCFRKQKPKNTTY